MGAADRRQAPGRSAQSGRRTTVVAVLATILAMLPVFLLGSVAILVRSELGFDEAALGLSLSCFYATTTLCSVPGGHVAERLGARRTLVVATSASACSLGGIALLAHSWVTMTAFLVLGGAANGLAQPASNLALAHGVTPTRMGFAFGVKQAAIPMAGLVAGLALPAVALTLGWRWAFAGCALAAVVIAGVAPRVVGAGPSRREPAAQEDAPRGPLIILACACAFGSAPGVALGAFLVQSSVESGLSAEIAGLILALGGAVGVLARLISGWLADRREGGHLTVVACMLVLGAGGYGLVAVSDGRIGLLIAGTTLAFGLAWGWPGLYFLAIVRLNPNAPAAASGVGQAGGAAGGVLGPLLFGMVVAAGSYPVAWWGAGASALMSALLMVVGRQAFIRRSRASAASEPVRAGQSPSLGDCDA